MTLGDRRPAAGPSYGRRLTELARLAPDEVAVVEVGEGADRCLTWAELDQRADALAAAWVRRGRVSGDVVAVCLPNCLEHLIACAGAWKLGAVPVVVRWDLPAWERRRVLGVIAPDVVVDNESALGDDTGVRSQPAGTEVVADAVSPHRFGVCTSGSTGTPKVVLHARSGQFLPEEAVTSAVVEAYGTLAGPQTLLVANALYHSSSITTVTLNLMAGRRSVLLRRFRPDLLQDALCRWAVTGFMAPTPQLLRLARWPGLEAAAFRNVGWIQHGAAPLPEWLGRFWIDLVGPERFFTSYGSAEAVGIVACRGDEWLTHPGTLGRGVLGTEVRILGADGQPVEPGSIGLIHLRRPGGPAGRYAGRGVSALEVGAEGFATVGDLGWMDEGGFVYLADRREDLIVTGGANVYPAEVEAAIGEHPAVADVVVIGLPDEEWGQRVHAIVQPEPGSALNEDAIRAFARGRLARYKVPKAVELVEEIPRSAAMKVNRRQLSEERTTHVP